MKDIETLSMQKCRSGRTALCGCSLTDFLDGLGGNVQWTLANALLS